MSASPDDDAGKTTLCEEIKNRARYDTTVNPYHCYMLMILSYCTRYLIQKAVAVQYSSTPHEQQHTASIQYIL